jgi:hypothetical protein
MKQELKDKEKTLKNLRMCYDGLLELAKKDPRIEQDFDMERFGVYVALQPKEIKNNVCDTHGCLLGNMGRLFEPKKEYFLDGFFNYYKFGSLEFPSLFIEGGGFFDETGRFLFDAEWGICQPTFKQAMERLKYVIDMDLEIGKWKFRKQSFIKE